MINSVIFILTALGFSLGLMHAGDRMLCLIGAADAQQNRAFSWGLGVTALIFLLSGLALTGLYTVSVLWAVWVAIVVLGLWRLPHLAPMLFETKELKPSETGWAVVAARIAIGVMLLALLATVMTPETRHDPFDYHLSVPMNYIHAGGAVELPWHVFSYMPKNGEMLYGLALAVGNDSLARLMHFIFGCFCLRLIYDWLKRYCGYEAGLISAFLIASLPVLGFVAVSAYIDLMRAFWELLALYELYELWQCDERKPRRRWLAFSALFAGMALATKYVSAAVFLPGYGILLLASLWRFRTSWSPPGIAACLLLGALPLTPWLFLNAVWTGNPVYPFLPSLFGANAPAADEAYAFFQAHRPSAEYFQSLGSMAGYFAERIGLLMLDGNALFMLGLIGLAAFPFRVRDDSAGRVLPRYAIAGIAIYATLGTAAFLALCDNDDGRFFLSILLILSVPTAFLLMDMRSRLERSASWAPLFIPMMIVILLGNAMIYRYSQLSAQGESIMPMLAESQRHAFLNNRFPHYRVTRWANENLPDDAFVLGMGYPLQRRAAARLKHGYFPFAQGLDDPAPGELARALAEAGYTHIYEPFIEVGEGVDLAILEDSHLKPLFVHRGTMLHKLIEAPAP